MIGSSTPPQRGGFTLVELLVVIAIIAVVMALTAGAYFTVMSGQQLTRTEDALRIMDNALQNNWNAVIEEAKKDAISPAVINLANGDMDRARVVWIMFRLTEAFPQSYTEVNNAFSTTAATLNGTIYGVEPTTVPGGQGRPWIPTNQRRYLQGVYYNRISKATNNNSTPESQSAACLYLALTQVSHGGLKLPEDQLPANIGDTDGDGVKELIDNWQKPISFIRFPIYIATSANPVIPAALGTELVGLNPRPTALQAYGDPIDPDGRMQQTAPGTGTKWCLGANGQLAMSLCNHPFGPAATPQPYYTPFIRSNGADGILGTTDDVVSFRLRVGARGD
jgi:prepilin-type N-terminal cleavage/methylation domain-containing protein